MAHLAPQDEARERIEMAASEENAYWKLSFTVTWNSAQDPYEKLQAPVDDADKWKSLMSAIAGGGGERGGRGWEKLKSF